jgi:succinate dehydrogenase/fumarate reductase flavoprotein subunit
MRISRKEWGKLYEVDVLILGTGASGVGAALQAVKQHTDVLMVGKGRLESSGSLGGGNDHFMAALDTDEPHDSREDFVGFHLKSAFGYRRAQIEQWHAALKPCLAVLDEVGTEYLLKPDGTRVRSVGFGQPGAWWLNITNGRTIKRNLAKKIRSLDVNVLDDFQITKMFATDGKFVGCMGFNVLTGEISAIQCKTAIDCLGFHAQRVTNNSTNNPFNCWFTPFTTGSYLVQPYEIGASIVNADIATRATLLPKSWGAPGMNGINNMGAHELNALGERFMGKYDPMMENGKRRNQVMGTYQELVEGKGPPFYMDMRHFSEEDAHHLQYVLMPGDKETYLDYCAARGIDFKKTLLEVEIGELSLSGMLLADDRMETSVRGLFAGCNFSSFSGAMCGGYVAAFYAAGDGKGSAMGELEESMILAEKARILAPLTHSSSRAVSYSDFENPIRQVMDYYAKYRRNMPGMTLGLERLALIEGYKQRAYARNLHELMRLHEAFDLLSLCQMHLHACLQRKESGRAMYELSDFPRLSPDLAKGLVVHRENGVPVYTWID